MACLLVAENFVSGLVRLGPLRLSAYGLCAALGLVAALGLSLRTARMAGIEPAEIWDAGLFGLGAAFVISRALLVVRNWPVFLHYPLLVLALPSLSYTGMALTAVAVALYLRRKHLPLLPVLDAWAPCAAFLAAFLEVGHWLEGSDAGMPWLRGGRLLPVQSIGAGLSTALMLYLLSMLIEKQSPGTVSAIGLLLGGLLAFLMTMVTQPAGAPNEWLEPGQAIAIGAMIVGVVVLSATKERVQMLSRLEVAELIENLLSGRARPYDHEKIIYKKFTDPLLIKVQKDFACVWGPLRKQDEEMLLGYARMLRENPNSEEKEESQ